MYVVVLDRDKSSELWQARGPFMRKEDAAEYAKMQYRETGRLWVVIPVRTP